MHRASFVWIENALDSKSCAATFAVKGVTLDGVAALEQIVNTLNHLVFQVVHVNLPKIKQ